jgi:hypothetical protein
MLHMNALIARCSQLMPSLRPGWYSIPLRLIIGYGFMEHGYAKLARGRDARHVTSDAAEHERQWDAELERCGVAAVIDALASDSAERRKELVCPGFHRLTRHGAWGPLVDASRNFREKVGNLVVLLGDVQKCHF